MTLVNMLRKGAEWLNRKLKQHAGETLVYSRGAHSVEITGVAGKTLMKLSSGMGEIRMEWTDADFLIEAADLVLNGSQVEPQRGDKIRWTSGGQTTVFEVMAPQGEPPWRWSDEYRTKYRIHVKQIGVE